MSTSIGEIVPREQLQLPPVCVEPLTEVPLLIQEAYPDKRNVQVRGALKVVSSQDA